MTSLSIPSNKITKPSSGPSSLLRFYPPTKSHITHKLPVYHLVCFICPLPWPNISAFLLFPETTIPILPPPSISSKRAASLRKREEWNRALPIPPPLKSCPFRCGAPVPGRRRPSDLTLSRPAIVLRPDQFAVLEPQLLPPCHLRGRRESRTGTRNSASVFHSKMRRNGRPPEHMRGRWRGIPSTWCVHFASLFYIIIYLYLSIYFILWCNTYVIIPYFACFAIIGDASVGARNQLEKYLSRYLTSEAPKIQKLIFIREDPRSQKMGQRALRQML